LFGYSQGKFKKIIFLVPPFDVEATEAKEEIRKPKQIVEFGVFRLQDSKENIYRGDYLAIRAALQSAVDD